MRDAGTAVSQPWSSVGPHTACLKYCSVSCFNKGPQGLTGLSLTRVRQAGAAKLTEEGHFSISASDPHSHINPTPGWFY